MQKKIRKDQNVQNNRLTLHGFQSFFGSWNETNTQYNLLRVDSNLGDCRKNKESNANPITVPEVKYAGD